MLGIFKKVKTSVKEVLTKADQRTGTSDAAEELLSRYQNNWKEIHLNSEKNSELAKLVDAQAGIVQNELQRRADVFKRLNEELRYSSTIQRDLLAVTEHLSVVHELCVAIEDALVLLEDACEEQEERQLEERHAGELVAFRSRRRHEVETLAVKMAEEYSKKMKRRHQQQQQSGRRLPTTPETEMLERHRYFREAFEEDMRRFNAGEPLRPGHITRPPEVAEDELANVELIDEQQAAVTELDSFLADASALPPTAAESDTLERQAFTNSCESAVSTASLEWDCTSDKLTPKEPEDSQLLPVDLDGGNESSESAGDSLLRATASTSDSCDIPEYTVGPVASASGEGSGAAQEVIMEETTSADEQRRSSGLLSKQEVAVVGPLVAAEL